MIAWLRRLHDAHHRRRIRILQGLGIMLAALMLLPFFLPGSIAAELPEHCSISYTEIPGYSGKMRLVECGKTEKPSVVLVHGLGQNGAADWYPVIPALEPHYRVIAFDLPAFGASDEMRGALTPKGYADLVDHVIRHYAGPHPILVGHSMGGAISLRYAADHPDVLSRLVLVDAAGILERTAYVKEIAELPFNTEYGPRFVRRIAAKLEEVSTALIEWANLAPDPVNLIRAINRFNSDSRISNSQAAVALELLDEDFSRLVPKVTVPTHIIWGDDDPIAPLRTGKVLHYRLQHSTFDRFKDAGHVPMSSHTEAFNALLVERLETPFPDPAPRIVPATSQGNLHCVDEVGVRFSGRYDTITIKNSKSIHLQNVTAREIRIIDSSVSFENLTVDTNQTALTVDHSVLLLTNGILNGATALTAKRSRIDMAGMTLVGDQCAMKVKTKARIILSVGEMNAIQYQGSIHGDFRLRRSNCLDRRFH
jgi:pimeloyl-ACP methyl ester carboxylesterase